VHLRSALNAFRARALRDRFSCSGILETSLRYSPRRTQVWRRTSYGDRRQAWHPLILWMRNPVQMRVAPVTTTRRRNRKSGMKWRHRTAQLGGSTRTAQRQSSSRDRHCGTGVSRLLGAHYPDAESNHRRDRDRARGRIFRRVVADDVGGRIRSCSRCAIDCRSAHCKAIGSIEMGDVRSLYGQPLVTLSVRVLWSGREVSRRNAARCFLSSECSGKLSMRPACDARCTHAVCRFTSLLPRRAVKRWA